MQTYWRYLRRIWAMRFVSVSSKLKCSLGLHYYPRRWTGLWTHRPPPGYWDTCFGCDYRRRTKE